VKEWKSQKRAWDEDQDKTLLFLIAEIGPHQWEQISLQLPSRTGKQCRERWHNQLNPLLKKARWSHEEDWILYILHETVSNRWAEITNVILGRSDNSIKNYWNSTLVHKQRGFERDLQNYMKRQVGPLSNEEALTASMSVEQVMQSMLSKYIYVARLQYFKHIREKIEFLQNDLCTIEDPEEIKITVFKIRLMTEALSPQTDLTETQGNTQLTKLADVQASSQVPAAANYNLKALVEQRERNQFVKLFLHNALCRNIQNALHEVQEWNGKSLPEIDLIPTASMDIPEDYQYNTDELLDKFLKSDLQVLKSGTQTKKHEDSSATTNFLRDENGVPVSKLQQKRSAKRHAKTHKAGAK